MILKEINLKWPICYKVVGQHRMHLTHLTIMYPKIAQVMVPPRMVLHSRIVLPISFTISFLISESILLDFTSSSRVLVRSFNFAISSSTILADSLFSSIRSSVDIFSIFTWASHFRSRHWSKVFKRSTPWGIHNALLNSILQWALEPPFESFLFWLLPKEIRALPLAAHQIERVESPIADGCKPQLLLNPLG